MCVCDVQVRYYLIGDATKKTHLLMLLRLYVRNRAVDSLASSLDILLEGPIERRLIPYIRYVYILYNWVFLCEYDIYAIMRIKLKLHKYNSHNVYFYGKDSHTPCRVMHKYIIYKLPFFCHFWVA